MLACAGAALIAASAHAEPAERVALRWEAPEGCPPAERVTAEVDRLLGPHGARPPKPLEVVARVTKTDAGGFRVRLETPGEGGPREREIAGASCAAIADATAVIIAFMIDPAAAAAPPPEPSPPPPPPPPPPPAPPVVPPAPATRGLHPSFRLLAWMGADAGSLPSVGFAAGGAAAVVLGPARIELGAGVWPGRSATSAQLPSAGGTISLIAGSLGACYDALTAMKRPFELGPCGGFELGRLHATGFGVSTPSEANTLWYAPKLGGHFAWSPVRRLALALRIDTVFPLSRPTFVLENVGPVHRPAAVAGRAAGGVELRF